MHVKFAEIFVPNLAMSVWAATLDKVLNIIVWNLKVQMRGEDLLQLRSIDDILVSLVEQLETLTSLILTPIVTPSSSDNVFHRLVVYTLFLQEALVYFISKIFNFFSWKSSETEIMQQSFKMRHDNPTISVFVVEIERILEISLDITWQLVLLEFAFIGNIYEISSDSMSSWLTCGLHFLI